ncbi:MAG: hypothetical protein ABFD85_02655, partial [Phycisphaerae bacterium]
MARTSFAADDFAGAGGSAVANGGLLRATAYPDGDDVEDVIATLNGTGSYSDFVSATYRASGVVHTSTDQNGTVHTYWYDDTSRLSRDSVTTVATGI